MTIYVDDLFTDQPRNAQAASHGNRWCHMFSDTSAEELHAFAQRLGLRRSYAQNEERSLADLHYDLVPSKRLLAVKLGAVEVDMRTGAKIRMKVRHGEASTEA